ncbi:MAG: hypothetical protein RL533_1402 [Pseudomonadota bacterium]
MELNLQYVEDACKELYIRALKLLPDDIKEGINDLKRKERDARAQVVLGPNERIICSVKIPVCRSITFGLVAMFILMGFF